MIKATVRKLRSSTKEILSAVSRGDTVLVTNRGKPCAKITPIRSNKRPIKDQLFGIWKNKKDLCSVKMHVKSLRKSRNAY
ncbi:hypothetical protein MNBD_BACTEROID05-96 [hydrothermal vent metagenome]|uniref:Antitoxin n=1 Tax=hydrothermal vent metagenome TaxID=652676 RepID=A0A3B0TVV3_9ZZZZ